MNKSIRWLAGCACLAMLAAAPASAQRHKLSGEDELARIVAGRTAGKPVNCISLTSIRSSRIIDHTAIVYESGRTIYVNRPRSGASSLDDDDILVTHPTGSDLCSLDIVHLVDRGTRMQSGFVGLDKFVPYTRPRR